MLLALALALAGLDPCHAAAPKTPKQEAVRAEPEVARLRPDVEGQLRHFEVEFTGNEVFTRGELLELLSCDHEAASDFIQGVASAGFVSESETSSMLEHGLAQLTNQLRARGYLRAEVRFDPGAEQPANGRKLIIKVNEGALYRIGKVEFKGAKLISPERLAEMFPLKAGDAANGEVIYTFLFEKLKKFYGDKGHIQYEADAEPTFTAEPGAREGVVDFLITLEEGKSFVVDRIEFEGNAKTPDGQLRPLLLLREGATYSQALADESLKRIEATGLFERIDRDRDVNYLVNEQQAEVRVRVRLREKSSP